MDLAGGPEGLDPLHPIGAVSVPWPCSEGCDYCALSSVWWVSYRCLCGVKVPYACVGLPPEFHLSGDIRLKQNFILHSGQYASKTTVLINRRTKLILLLDSD